MVKFAWASYPHSASYPSVRAWFETLIATPLAPDSLVTYAKALEQFLLFYARTAPERPEWTRGPEHVGYEMIARYEDTLLAHSPEGTRLLRLRILRLYYDHLIDRGIRDSNPVDLTAKTAHELARGHRVLNTVAPSTPWLPSDREWLAILETAGGDKLLRNKVMLLVAYEAALRRNELVRLTLDDIDWEQQSLAVRANVTVVRDQATAPRRDRLVPLTPHAERLLRRYLEHRARLKPSSAAVFVSESKRGIGRPLVAGAWSDIVEGLADATQSPRLTTQTLRDLRLVHLLRAAVPAEHVAELAGRMTRRQRAIYGRWAGPIAASPPEVPLTSLDTAAARWANALLGIEAPAKGCDPEECGPWPMPLR